MIRPATGRQRRGGPVPDRKRWGGIDIDGNRPVPGRRQSGGRALRQTDGDGQPPPAAGGGSAAEELAGEAALRRHHRGRQDNGNEAAEPAEVEEEEEDRKIMKRVGATAVGGASTPDRPSKSILIPTSDSTGLPPRDRLRLFSLLAVFKRGATAQRGNGSIQNWALPFLQTLMAEKPLLAYVKNSLQQTPNRVFRHLRLGANLKKDPFPGREKNEIGVCNIASGIDR